MAEPTDFPLRSARNEYLQFSILHKEDEERQKQCIPYWVEDPFVNETSGFFEKLHQANAAIEREKALKKMKDAYQRLNKGEAGNGPMFNRAMEEQIAEIENLQLKFNDHNQNQASNLLPQPTTDVAGWNAFKKSFMERLKANGCPNVQLGKDEEKRAMLFAADDPTQLLKAVALYAESEHCTAGNNPGKLFELVPKDMNEARVMLQAYEQQFRDRFNIKSVIVAGKKLTEDQVYELRGIPKPTPAVPNLDTPQQSLGQGMIDTPTPTNSDSENKSNRPKM